MSFLPSFRIAHKHTYGTFFRVPLGILIPVWHSKERNMIPDKHISLSFACSCDMEQPARLNKGLVLAAIVCTYSGQTLTVPKAACSIIYVWVISSKICN